MTFERLLNSLSSAINQAELLSHEIKPRQKREFMLDIMDDLKEIREDAKMLRNGLRIERKVDERNDR